MKKNQPDSPSAFSSIFPQENDDDNNEVNLLEAVVSLLDDIEDNTKKSLAINRSTKTAVARPAREAHSAGLISSEGVAPKKHSSKAPSNPIPPSTAAHASTTPSQEQRQGFSPASPKAQRVLNRDPSGRIIAAGAPKGGAGEGIVSSRDALEKKREHDNAKAQSAGLVDTFKQHLAGWDGSISGGDKAEGLKDAAGLAAGGPLWGALQELNGIMGGKDDDETGLAASLKKTLADKTGLTAIKEKFDGAKSSLHAKVVDWAGGSRPEAQGEAAATVVKDAESNGHALNPGGKSDDSETLQNSYDLALKESSEDSKRHEELVSAIRKIGGDGGGLFGGGKGGGLFGDRRDRGAKGKGTGKGKGKLGRLRGKAGMFAAGASLFGGSLLGGMFGGDSGSAIETAAETAADLSSTASSAASASTGKLAGGAAAKGGGKIAGKFGANAAKAIPIVGQALAAGMAIYDGVQGWNDTESQKETFGLEDGAEVTTGQKSSYAAANILDMGGLLSGGASLLGFDVSTGDIAKGLHGAGSWVGDQASGMMDSAASLFGFGDDSKATPQAPAQEQPGR